MTKQETQKQKFLEQICEEHRHNQVKEPEAVTKEFATRLEQQMNNSQKNPFFPHCLPQFPNELFEDWVKDKLD